MSRFKSPVYLINLALLLPYIAIIILQIVFRIDFVDNSFPFHCSVGMELPASIISLGYDVILSVLYISIFIKYYCFPNTAQQTAHQSSSLHMMAKRNSIAAFVSLLTSCANYIILISLKGVERGLVASSSAATVILFCFVMTCVTELDFFFFLVCYHYLCIYSLGYNTSSRNSIKRASFAKNQW